MVCTLFYFDIDEHDNVFVKKSITNIYNNSDNMLTLIDRPGWNLDKAFVYKNDSFLLGTSYTSLTMYGTEDYEESCTKILNIFMDIVAKCKNLDKVYIKNINLPLEFYTNILCKNILTLSLTSDLNVTDNFLNIIADQYEKIYLLYVEDYNFKFIDDVYFTNLDSLHLICKDSFEINLEILERIHGVKKIYFDIQDKYTIDVLLKFFHLNLKLDFGVIIIINSQLVDDITCFPHISRIELNYLGLQDKAFQESYELFHMYTDDELFEYYNTNNDLHNTINFCLFISHVLYRMIYVKKMKLQIFDVNKTESRVNPIYHTIRMNSKVHESIIKNLSIVLISPPEQYDNEFYND